jgi:hypothetical protein
VSPGGRAGEKPAPAPTGNGRGWFRAASLALLLVAAVVVAAVVVRARTPKLELEVLHIPQQPFSPDGDGHRDKARISFYVRDSDPHARVQIVGPDNEVIRTLYRGPLVAYEHNTFPWNGRRQGGRLANPREGYRLRVALPGQDREMVYPTQIRLAQRTGR